jgi:S1-C subfamily serine protease
MLKTSLLCFSSLLLFSPAVLADLTVTPSTPPIKRDNKNAQNEQAKIPDSVYEFAQKITVKIITDDNRASGTLIGKRNNTYLVLTNAHVIRESKNITINTSDGKNYKATIVNNPLPEEYDLILLKFTSQEKYTIAQKDNISIPVLKNPVISAGYPVENEKFTVTEGTITQIPDQSLKEGYSIGYTNSIQQGMSGGPIIDSKGLLLGINGRYAHPIVNSGYVYHDGKKANLNAINLMRQVSWGISINTLLTHIKPEIIEDYNLPKPQVNLEVKKSK